MAVPPTVATPSPTPCSDKTFWYDGQVCTNEKVPPDGEENYASIQECCNANFRPGSHVDGTCDYVDVCYEAPTEKPEMSMHWDIVESFGKSGKSTSGYVDSYGMIDDYTGNLHDSSKSRKGASKSNKDGGKSSKGKSSKESGSNENYYDEGHGNGNYSDNGYDGGSHGSSGKSDKTGSDSINGGGEYGYTDAYTFGSQYMNDAGKSGKSPGSSVGGSSGSTNDYNGYVPATGYRLGTTILSASVMDMQLALDTDDLDKEMRGTNKTLAPTPGFDRPSTPFPTEFTPPPAPSANTPSPTIISPAPTTCEEQQFWYNGNECTNEEFPVSAVILCCDDKFGPGSSEDGTCLYKDICSTVPPSPSPVSPAPSPQPVTVAKPSPKPISSAKPSPKPITMSMNWDFIESFGSTGSGKGYSSSGYGYNPSAGNTGSSSKSGKNSSSKSDKSSSGKSGKGSKSSGKGTVGYGYDGNGAMIDGIGEGSLKSGKSPPEYSEKGSESSGDGNGQGHSYNGYDYGLSSATSGGSSGESNSREGCKGYNGRRHLRIQH
ncbi:hypothetical protein ACHAW6_006717 [Cyclotella cf. meneghiniana]